MIDDEARRTSDSRYHFTTRRAARQDHAISQHETRSSRRAARYTVLTDDATQLKVPYTSLLLVEAELPAITVFFLVEPTPVR